MLLNDPKFLEIDDCDDGDGYRRKHFDIDRLIAIVGRLIQESDIKVRGWLRERTEVDAVISFTYPTAGEQNLKLLAHEVEDRIKDYGTVKWSSYINRDFIHETTTAQGRLEIYRQLDLPLSQPKANNVVELRPQQRQYESPPSTQGHVYFTENGPDFIKIGWTSVGPNHRRSALQTATPYELRVILAIPGTMETEQELHRQFQHLHERGEWFKKGPELLDFIAEELKKQETPPAPERDWLHVATPTENHGT